jgi:metal-responsive CopG/Arc/MetJ family transcriptional regulator
LENVIVAFRIDKALLKKFDKICRSEGVYIRSEGFRKAVISVVKRGKFNNG